MKYDNYDRSALNFNLRCYSQLKNSTASWKYDRPWDLKWIKIPLLKCSRPLRWRHNGRDGVLNHQPPDCLLNRLYRRRSKKTSKFHVTGLCAGNSPVTGEFPAPKASNAENVFIWWRHHAPIWFYNVTSCVAMWSWHLTSRLFWLDFYGRFLVRVTFLTKLIRHRLVHRSSLRRIHHLESKLNNHALFVHDRLNTYTTRIMTMLVHS